MKRKIILHTTEQRNKITKLTCMYYSTMSYNLARGTTCLVKQKSQNPEKQHPTLTSKYTECYISISYIQSAEFNVKIQNDSNMMVQEKPTPMLPAVKPQQFSFHSCSFIVHMIWNFCLAVQGHILCHDCSDFRIHVLLQNHKKRTPLNVYPIKLSSTIMQTAK